jgi:hypothetical protein
MVDPGINYNNHDIIVTIMQVGRVNEAAHLHRVMDVPFLVMPNVVPEVIFQPNAPSMFPQCSLNVPSM